MGVSVELRALGRQLWALAQLMRLDKPIGIFLLLWPLCWALWIGAQGTPPMHLLLVFLAGTVVMRSAGCVINDFADRGFDPHVKRTQQRPLAARRATPREALLLFVLLMAVALWLVSLLDARTMLWSVGGALLTGSYPFMKRWFPVPQFYLGAAFGWAVPMAMVALQGEVGRLGWLLFAVTLLWAAVYDTQYAMVDRDDDLRLGVRSSAIYFGDMDRFMVGALQAMVLLGLYLAGRQAQLGAPFQLALLAGAGLFAWQQWLMRKRGRAECFRAFLNNGWFGLVVWLGILAGMP